MEMESFTYIESKYLKYVFDNQGETITPKHYLADKILFKDIIE